MLMIRMCVINFRALIIESLHIITHYLSDETKMSLAKLIILSHTTGYKPNKFHSYSIIRTVVLFCNQAPQIEANYWEESRESRRRIILGAV
jgi:hypothetical protein